MTTPAIKRTALIALLVLGTIRIVSTYTIFSETADEPMHLGAGLQILTEHRYAMQLQNPPLPRLLIALAPYAAGARIHRGDDPMRSFYLLEGYKTSLFLARLGTLIFFFIGTLATWAWARQVLGEAVAIAAMFFYTTQPSLLGHSALATLDAAGTAGTAVALLAFSRWLARPSAPRASLLGAAWGFAICCKLLCIAYVPLACAAIYAVHLMRDADTRARWRSITTIALVPPIASLIVWAGYGFSVAPARELAAIPKAFPESIAGRMLANLDGSTMLPAPMLIRGVAEMIAVNRDGFPGYALRMWSSEGWWWYFPLTLVLKTTLAALLLVVIAFVAARHNGPLLGVLAATFAILGLSMTTHVDIGVRYILPIYVPLSVAAGAALVWMLRHRQRLIRGAAIALVTWHFVASIAEHPDYLAYFNELAIHDPSYYLVDSNLDWGQDTLRLRDEVRRLKIESLGVGLFGSADLTQLGFPAHFHVDPAIPTSGWIAVSDHNYRWSRPYGGWSWLDREHCRRVGKSIRLCRVD